MTDHTLSASPETVHWGFFDASLSPVLRVRSGDRVTIESVSGAREESAMAPVPLLPEHARILEKCSPRLGPHILTGPVWVEDAEPGDILEVKIESVELRQPWGYNTVRPLRGGLPEDFPQLHRQIIPIDMERRIGNLPWGLNVPLKPFFGVMAVGPRPAYGAVSTIEPREYGGNMDNKELGAGSTVFFPVQTRGALFSAGDGHAVQGDGEVSLSALETALRGTFTFKLHKAQPGKTLTRPRAITPTHYITMAFDPDLDNAAKDALREMIAWLGELKGWKAIDAYVSCSLACDLHVTQIVDGNKGIHAMFARALLDK
jgi:acetamidase/formamidase